MVVLPGLGGVCRPFRPLVPSWFPTLFGRVQGETHTTPRHLTQPRLLLGLVVLAPRVGRPWKMDVPDGPSRRPLASGVATPI